MESLKCSCYFLKQTFQIRTFPTGKQVLFRGHLSIQYGPTYYGTFWSYHILLFIRELTHSCIDFANVRMVQIGCVLDVLAEAIERVKISLILPKLLEHPTHMAQILNGTKFEKAVHLVESFVRRREFILRESVRR